MVLTPVKPQKSGRIMWSTHFFLGLGLLSAPIHLHVSTCIDAVGILCVSLLLFGLQQAECSAQAQSAAPCCGNRGQMSLQGNQSCMRQVEQQSKPHHTLSECSASTCCLLLPFTAGEDHAEQLAQPLRLALTFFSGTEVGAPTATSASGLYVLVAVSSPPVAPWRAGSYFCGCDWPRGRAPSPPCTLDSSCRRRCSTCTVGQAGRLTDRSCQATLGQAVLHVPAVPQVRKGCMAHADNRVKQGAGGVPLGLQPDRLTRLLQGAVLLVGCAVKDQHSATTSTAAGILGRVQVCACGQAFEGQCMGLLPAPGELAAFMLPPFKTSSANGLS